MANIIDITTQQTRDTLDPIVEHVLQALRELESDFPETNFEETLNYLFKSILNTVYAGGGYRSIVEAVGVLEATKLEVYAKLTKEQ
jgi:hypothetical protein